MSDQHVECGCDERPQPLLSTDKALTTLINAAKAISTTELLTLDKALGRVLSANICANINVPGFDNSAMDGYAIHLKEDQINTPGVRSFEITDRIPAGATGAELQPGCAARIFTGAPIPKGTNTVIMQEECEVSADGHSIETWRPLSLNENIRPMGNDIQSGNVILTKGSLLKAQDIALAASVGINALEVFSKIRVGIFFTGDELVEPGHELKPGQIYDSNRYALVAMLTNLGCDINNLGRIKDTLEDTISALDSLQTQCDLIITTGGVSVGEEDHVKPAVEKLGELNLWRIKMKPGKPLAFGQIGQSAFIGLPGNPVSAMVTFLLFARPFIKKTQGCANYLNAHFKVAVNFDWHKAKPRREFVRVKLDQSTLPATVSQYPKQGSDVLSSMVWADGFAEIPEDSILKSGEMVNFYPFNEMIV